eukprot:6064578-Amphidinium_carterae.1
MLAAGASVPSLCFWRHHRGLPLTCLCHGCRPFKFSDCEASSQAVLETFAILVALFLVALCCWQRKWLPQTPIVVLSDSTAALAAVVKSSSAGPSINFNQSPLRHLASTQVDRQTCCRPAKSS